MSNLENQAYRKTVSFANNTQSNSFGYSNNYNRNMGSYNPNLNQTTSFNNTNRQSTYNQQVSYNARPSTVSTTYNQGSSQVFTNASIIFGNTGVLGRNPSVVVKPDSLVKIEIYSPELNGSRNRHYSSRLACFIKSLNSLRIRDDAMNENSFVNGGVWAKPFKGRDVVTIVINGTHIVESFPLTIFNEDPNWHYHNEIKNYRKSFINTISQFSDCNFVTKFEI